MSEVKTKLRETKKLEFHPTKEWVRTRKKRPSSCEDKDCYCICDDWKGEYGACIGIQPDNDSKPDIISLCCSYYDPKVNKARGHQFLWHPQEANWIGTLLCLASVEAWGLIPEYRALMRSLVAKRQIGSHKTGRDKEAEEL
jgi:hypothetical protein